MISVILVDDTPDRASTLPSILRETGFDVSEISMPETLHATNGADVIVVDTAIPTRTVFEQLRAISDHKPRPVVMFSADSSRASIRAAVEAGVTSYIVDGMAPERLAPIVEVAIARFEAYQALKTELDATKLKLSERKLVERAKGILMKSRNLPEDQAYRALRKLAMDKNQKLGDVARQVIEVSELLS